jgi:glycosyltransferase involved in cell wall biosynthesis
MSAQYARQLLAIRDHLACRERLHFLGRVPPEVLFPLYGGAELFVFPSLEETFGLPLVEAMGAGTPVIASDWRLAPGGEAERFNVGPEICGEAAEFFNPTDAASLVGAMHRVLTNSTRREVLARMGPVRASELSWDKAAASLLAIFEEAAASAAARGRR